MLIKENIVIIEKITEYNNVDRPSSIQIIQLKKNNNKTDKNIL